MSDVARTSRKFAAKVPAPAPIPGNPIPHDRAMPQRAPNTAFYASGPVAGMNVRRPVRVQTRLAIGQTGDPYEREADQIAERVMSTSSVQSPRAAPPGIQRMTATPAGETGNAPESVDRILATPGMPLQPAVAGEMGARLGRDFSRVRVHVGADAARSASEVNALAYTAGQNVVFGDGQYNPGTAAGMRLLAHELVHTVQQGENPPSALQRTPTAQVTGGEMTVNPPDAQPEAEKWEHLNVVAKGMDDAAMVLAGADLHFQAFEGRENVFVGLHPEFIKVYDKTGKSLARIPLQKIAGLKFNPGVYLALPQGLIALTQSTSDASKIGLESAPSVIGQRPYTDEEKKAMADEDKKATEEGRPAKTPAAKVFNLEAAVTDPARYRSLLETPPNALVIYFSPSYDLSGTGKGNGESAAVYSSPIQGRGDGEPANNPPWPVAMEGPRLAPIDSDPTYSAKVDWGANGNYTVSSQVISQIGETIHYKWEMYDITQYAKKAMAKDPTAANAPKDPSGSGTAGDAKPEKTLQQRIDDFKASKEGTGKDVTGMGGANREFAREFEDWQKDNRRAQKGVDHPTGDTVAERLSNEAANRLSLELAPVSLLLTAIGASLRWLADLFAGPRQQQEIPLKTKGIYLIRVITTPGINEDREGKKIIRPPSVDAKVVEVTPMDTAVHESLDEPSAQLAELKAQIDVATAEGNKSKAEYLSSLLAEAKQRFQGSPIDLLKQKRDEKQKELEDFRAKHPTLSDYSRKHDVDALDAQIALFERHQGQLDPGSSLKRVNATLISEVTAEQYPLLISAGPMAMENGKHRWMVSDVTNRDGDAFIGLGDKPSEAFHSALLKFGGNAAYGRGRIGARTEGLGLEAGAPAEFLIDSAPTDWALAEKRIDDLVTTLAALGLMVATAGTAGAIIGAAAAAARLIQRWRAGKLSLDPQTIGDVLGVLGGLGAAGQLAAGLRLQKLGGVFTILQEGGATEAQIAAATEAIRGAQQVAKGVELANEALGFAGVIWGDVSFIDQMMTISSQEESNGMTHAAARRARANAISSAVQNNGLFIAANVLKAKQAAKPEEHASPAPAEKAPTEKQPIPEQKTPADTPAPEAKPANDDSVAASENKPAQKAGEPVPIGERQATLGELQAAVSKDLQGIVEIDTKLEGDDVRADYTVDPDSGLITDIKLRCSPDARPNTVGLHEATIRTMQGYQGFMGRVRMAISWLADIIGVDTLKPENKVSFEAALEIQKLPKIITDLMARMSDMQPGARDEAAGELENLQNQLDKSLRTLDIGEGGEAAGFVAAKGLSKAKQKKYAELQAKLRTEEPLSDEHKATRWEMYELTGGDMDYPPWERVYEANQGRAKKARKAEDTERARIGWGTPQLEVDVPGGGKRRLDIGENTPALRRAVEVKAYETGRVYASSEIVDEAEADGKLVKFRGWEITWLFIDCAPSGPLQTELRKNGVTIEIRMRKGIPH